VNYADRLVFGVLLQDIKIDLSLSDTQLGFLSGIAFALFYALIGIPIARWADHGNRAAIISVCTMLWSAAVALCGTAANLWQLLLMRVGVAVGESGCYPTSMSLISDYFNRAERPRAVARYMLGIPLASIVGFFAAGWLNELYGWRLTFVLFGLPGLLLGVLAMSTLKEPRADKVVNASAQPAPSMKEVATALWTNAAFRHLFMAFSFWGFFGQGILQWQPTFFVRSHHLTTGELGTWFAVVHGVGGLVGVYLGGELAPRFATHNERRQLVGVAWAYSALALLGACVYLAPQYHSAIAVLAVYAVISNSANGPIFATVQTLVPPHMRAIALALMYLSTNLIGLGFGPLALGAVSDVLHDTLGDESLRYALLAFCPGYLFCAWHFWRASRTVLRDLCSAAADDEATTARTVSVGIEEQT
jgi:MFS transporter, Spinster family, sphingosine-1-phosphate transporter